MLQAKWEETFGKKGAGTGTDERPGDVRTGKRNGEFDAEQNGAPVRQDSRGVQLDTGWQKTP
jgi:hypothetical protein